MAAASNNDYCKSNSEIHIPLCDNTFCRDKLLLLAETFEQNGITCEYKYRANGLYKFWFEKFVQTCQFTVLHICPQFLKKVPNNFDFANVDLGMKLVCVKFDKLNNENCDTEHAKQNDDETYHYFRDFSTRDISNEADLRKFVDEMKILVENGSCGLRKLDEPKSKIVDFGLEPPSPHENTTHPENSDRSEHFVYKYYNKGDEQVLKVLEVLKHPDVYEIPQGHSMQVFPDMFGETSGQDVHVGAKYLQAEYGSFDRFESLKTIEDLRSRLNALGPKPKQTVLGLILQKVIPEFYNLKHMWALAQVATCNQPDLQQRALLMLELLIFEGHAQHNKDHLRKTESLLSEFLRVMRDRYTSNKEVGLLPTIQRMSTLLVMLCYELTINCPTDKIQQSPKKPFRPPSLYKRKTDDYINNEILQNKDGRQLIDSVKQFCGDNELYPLVKKLVSRSNPVQMTVIFEYLKKIYATMDEQVLKFLRQYITKKCPPQCLSAIVHALILFLCHGLRNASDRFIQEICTATLDVINTVQQKDFSNEAHLMLPMLLFDKTPVIRQGVIEYFQNREIYYKDLEQNLKAQITRLLFPFLILDSKRSINKSKTNWLSVLGTFNQKHAVVLYHKPTKKDHWDKNETQFIKFVDTMHRNQIKMLQILQHENVMELIAYQVTCIPQFYILEDYVTTNLQTALKNKNDNKKYFDQVILMNFLLCAVTALEYCHSKGIVHRNLTAESLFIFGDNKVKLGGFTLALDLDERAEVIVVNGCSEIPTRWSAPESLNKLTYSKASDVCMYGHLMYEICTHGALPYSHMDLSNVECVKAIAAKQIHLCHEPCIKKEVYEQICRCVAFYPKDRPDTATLKESMSKLMEGTTSDYRPRYPSLSETPSGNIRQPSSTSGKGTPDYDDLYCENIYVVYISSAQGLQQVKMGEGYLFRENVTRTFSQQMKDQLHSNRSIIPLCMTIEVLIDDMHVINYFIPSKDVHNILDVILQRLLGKDICDYLTVMITIAEMLERLHNASFVLGHISTSSVFLEFDFEPKVHCVSWAYLNCIQTFSDRTQLFGSAMESYVAARAAPEVLDSGLYSPASDVFCFGHLLKDITSTLRKSPVSAQHINDHGYEQISDEKQPLIKPHHQQLLMDIVHECIVPDRCRRLTLAMVIEKIENVRAQIRSELGDENSNSITHLKGQFLSCSDSATDNGFSNDPDSSDNPDSTIYTDCMTQIDSHKDADSQFNFKTGLSDMSSLNSICGPNNDLHTEPKMFVETQKSRMGIDRSSVYHDAYSCRAVRKCNEYTNLPRPKMRLRNALNNNYSIPAKCVRGYKYYEKKNYYNTEVEDVDQYQEIEEHEDSSDFSDPVYETVESCRSLRISESSLIGIPQCNTQVPENLFLQSEGGSDNNIVNGVQIRNPPLNNYDERNQSSLHTVRSDKLISSEQPDHSHHNSSPTAQGNHDDNEVYV